MTEQIKYELVGMESLLAKLKQTGRLKPLRNFWERVTLAVVKAARLRSPYRTGRLQGSIVHRIDTAEIPLWGEVSTGVVAKGFSYPTLLEESSKTHYLATPRMGQPTKAWFSGALIDADGPIKQGLETLAGEVSSDWEGA